MAVPEWSQTIEGFPELRDLFAMASLAGHRSHNEGYEVPAPEAARWAYADADAMLEARKAS